MSTAVSLAPFMCLADEINGNQGMIQTQGFEICVTKHGNTPEIKVRLPLLKQGGSKQLADVCNKNFYGPCKPILKLNKTVNIEVWLNNINPDTRTAAYPAMGDALAICLLELCDFPSKDFAQYHHSCALREQHHLKVEEVFFNNQSAKEIPGVLLRDIVEISDNY